MAIALTMINKVNDLRVSRDSKVKYSPGIASPQAPCDLHPCKNAESCYPSDGKYDFKWKYRPGFCGKTNDKGKNLVTNQFYIL